MRLSIHSAAVIGLAGLLVLAGFGMHRHIKAAGPATKKNAGKQFDPSSPLPDAVMEIVDASQDGMIDDQEAGEAIKKIQTAARAKSPAGKAITAALDANGDRRVDEDEARSGVARAKATNKGVSQEVTAIFDGLDTDHDTRISVGEFKQLVGKLGIIGLLIQPKLGEFFNQMDRNGDGQISPTESQRGAELLQQEIQRAQAGQAAAAKAADPSYQQAQQFFGLLDKDRNEQLSKKEVQRQKELSTNFNQADTNFDQQLSLDEVAALLKQRKKAAPAGKKG